jgi:hypothetical protein
VNQKQELYGLSAQKAAASRRTYDHDLGPMLGLPSGLVKMRAPTKREQDRAAAGAHEYAVKLADGNAAAASDPDILTDAKCAYIAFEASRDAKEPEKLPAFFSPSWMMENLTAPQIAAIVNIVNEVIKAESPGPKTLDDEAFEAIVDMCNGHADDEIPQLALATMNREFLSHVVVVLSAKLAEARSDVEAVIDSTADV